jgi:VanZ family protein
MGMSKFGPDKWKHFFVGLAMGIVLQLVCGWLLPTHVIVATLITFIIVVAISYGFELYSKFTGHGHYELLDAIAAIIGGVLGMGAVLIF